MLRSAHQISAIAVGFIVCTCSLTDHAVCQEALQRTAPEIKKILVVNSNGEEVEMSTRLASFYLGKNLGYQAALRARNIPEEKFKDSILMTARFAKALDVELGELPEIKGGGDIWKMMDFVRNQETGAGTKVLKIHEMIVEHWSSYLPSSSWQDRSTTTISPTMT